MYPNSFFLSRSIVKGENIKEWRVVSGEWLGGVWHTMGLGYNSAILDAREIHYYWNERAVRLIKSTWTPC
jgi:hypothetical protein